MESWNNAEWLRTSRVICAMQFGNYAVSPYNPIMTINFLMGIYVWGNLMRLSLSQFDFGDYLNGIFAGVLWIDESSLGACFY